MVACGSNEHFNSGFDIGVILELVMYIFIELTAAVARFGTKASYLLGHIKPFKRYDLR